MASNPRVRRRYRTGRGRPSKSRAGSDRRGRERRVRIRDIARSDKSGSRHRVGMACRMTNPATGMLEHGAPRASRSAGLRRRQGLRCAAGSVDNHDEEAPGRRQSPRPKQKYSEMRQVRQPRDVRGRGRERRVARGWFIASSVSKVRGRSTIEAARPSSRERAPWALADRPGRTERRKAPRPLAGSGVGPRGQPLSANAARWGIAPDTHPVARVRKGRIETHPSPRRVREYGGNSGASRKRSPRFVDARPPRRPRPGDPAGAIGVQFAKICCPRRPCRKRGRVIAAEHFSRT